MSNIKGYSYVKKLIGIVLFFLGVLVLVGCSQKASKYTESEHIQRVSERIQKKYIETDLDLGNEV